MVNGYSDLVERLRAHEQAAVVSDIVTALLDLAAAIHAEGDSTAAAALLPRIVLECAEHPAGADVAEGLKLLIMKRYKAPYGSMLLQNVTSSPEQHAYVAVKLLAGERLTAGEYLVIVDGLATGRQQQVPHVVSVLHLLRECDGRSLTDALLFMAEDSGLPWLPLRRFWPHGAAFMSLPIDYVSKRGAVAFDRIEDTLLVGVLNPYDQALQADIAQHVGLACQFYLVPPGDYDGTVSLARESVAP
jgi:hypothetical protein